MKIFNFPSHTRIVLFYLIFACLWILVSDNVISLLTNDPELVIKISKLKGIAFVGITAILLFLERRHADEKLKKSEKNFRTLADVANDWEYWIGIDNKFIYTSPSCQRITGYSADEFLNDPTLIEKIIHSNDQPIYYKLNEDMKQSKENLVSEFRIVTRDGQERWIRHVCRNVFDDDGEPLGIRASNSDITEFKQTVERNRLFATIVESSEDAIIGKDANYNIISWNSGAEKIYGYTKEEIVGKSTFNLFSTEDHDNALNILVEIKKGNFIKNKEIVQQRRDGKPVIMSLTISPIKDETGLIIGSSTIGRDITEQKKVEEENKLQQEQLAQADKMITLGTLVSGVAHEINNPTNFITLNTPIIKEAWVGVKPILENHYKNEGDFQVGRYHYSLLRERIELLFDGLFDGAERIKHIVLNLKDFARPDPSDMDQLVDLKKVIEKAVNLLKDSIDKQTKNFSLKIESNLPALIGSLQKLEQVIINLIQNSLEALANNQQLVSVTAWFEQNENSIIAEIKDEGSGIDDQILTRIMDPFFTTKRSSGGTGIGLAICARILKDHGGKLSFDSELGKGTKATVILPVNKKPQKYKD